jgi:flagellar motor switch protein FliG
MGNDDIKIDGKKQAAELLSHLDEESRNRILKGIAEKDPGLAETLKKGLFSFEQVLNLEVLELQKVMQAHPIALFALALRGMDEELKKRVFSKLSARQGNALQEEIDSIGPRKLSEVKLAQEKITEKARELHEQKQITLR